jgi:hypothetical protein
MMHHKLYGERRLDDGYESQVILTTFGLPLFFKGNPQKYELPRPASHWYLQHTWLGLFFETSFLS